MSGIWNVKTEPHPDDREAWIAAGLWPSLTRLSALYNLIRAASLAVDNNDRMTAKAVLTNAEAVVLAMMEQGK